MRERRPEQEWHGRSCERGEERRAPAVGEVRAVVRDYTGRGAARRSNVDAPARTATTRAVLASVEFASAIAGRRRRRQLDDEHPDDDRDDDREELRHRPRRVERRGVVERADRHDRQPKHDHRRDGVTAMGGRIATALPMAVRSATKRASGAAASNARNRMAASSGKLDQASQPNGQQGRDDDPPDEPPDNSQGPARCGRDGRRGWPIEEPGAGRGRTRPTLRRDRRRPRRPAHRPGPAWDSFEGHAQEMFGPAEDRANEDRCGLSPRTRRTHPSTGRRDRRRRTGFRRRSAMTTRAVDQEWGSRRRRATGARSPRAARPAPPGTGSAPRGGS